MSDPDAMPDPIDKAYVEAEAVLSDETAREARRARVLAAVARQGAPDAPAARPRAWRRGGWLAAACVAGLALVVATQVYRPPAPLPPPEPPPAPGAPAAPAKAAPAPIAPAQAAAPPAAAPRDSVRSITPPSPPAESEAQPAAPVVSAQAPAPLSALPSGAAPAPIAEAPPPPPPPAIDAARDEAPKARTASRASTSGADSVSEIVVTSEKRQSRRQSVPAAVSAFTGRIRQAFDPGARLRAAAADGRTDEVQTLLEHGARVDSQDADGETALMKSIQGDHPDAAALLRRHGASLDRQNRAGESAKDMAKAEGDPELDEALGISP